MINLETICSEMSEDVNSVIAWCDDQYNSYFASYFQNQRELFERLQSKKHPITDEELEMILTDIPLQLFSVAEKISKLRLTQEVVRVRNKQELAERKSKSTQTTQTKKAEEAELEMLENKLVDVAYSSVIARVDSEISFSRELIMTAKKIWDRRRQGENTNPVSIVDTSGIHPPERKTFYEQTQASKGQAIYGTNNGNY